jgi:hypothetical protein
VKFGVGLSITVGVKIEKKRFSREKFLCCHIRISEMNKKMYIILTVKKVCPFLCGEKYVILDPLLGSFKS